MPRPLTPIAQVSPGPRGQYEYRHHACWADYSKRPYMARQYINDRTRVQDWCMANVPLFKYLSDQLRLWDPQAYRVMADTPWLDNLIVKGATHLGQKRSIP